MKSVFAANIAVSVFFISLLLSADVPLPYHFTMDSTGCFCASMKIGTTSSKKKKLRNILLLYRPQSDLSPELLEFKDLRSWSQMILNLDIKGTLTRKVKLEADRVHWKV